MGMCHITSGKLEKVAVHETNVAALICLHRSATKTEINKAYRKLARKWHPDAYEGENKEKAEKMFLDIAAAKEVLTDPGIYGC